jgi:beta-lactamase class A
MNVVLLALSAAFLIGGMLGAAAQTARPAVAPIDGELDALARSLAPANVAIAIKPVGGGAIVGVNLDRAMPMQSVFKAALGAVALARVDVGSLDLSRQTELAESDLAPPFSPIADAWPKRRGHSVAELIEAAVGHSDNTAADILFGLIGGPQAVTSFLRDHGIEGMRIDRTERELQTDSVGLPAFRPDMRGETAWSAAMEAVPEPARRAAIERYLADPRDTATPRAAIDFLEKLSKGRLLSERSTSMLLRIMTESPTGRTRLRAGLPPGATIAHKTGTGRRVVGIASSINDIGIATLPDGRRMAIAVFVNGAKASDADIDALHARVAALASR